MTEIHHLQRHLLPTRYQIYFRHNYLCYCHCDSEISFCKYTKCSTTEIFKSDLQKLCTLYNYHLMMWKIKLKAPKTLSPSHLTNILYFFLCAYVFRDVNAMLKISWLVQDCHLQAIQEKSVLKG